MRDIGVCAWSMQSTYMRPRPHAHLYREVVAQGRLAESLGFDSLWMGEHHFVYDGYCPSTIAASTAVIAGTSRLKVGSGVLLFPLHGSSHRGKKAVKRLTTAFPNAVMVHTPVHASWLNQVEIFFSVVQRKVVSPNDFTDLSQVTDRLRAFEDRYNATAQPFQWRFTTTDLDDLLARLDRHVPDRQEQSSAPQAA